MIFYHLREKNVLCYNSNIHMPAVYIDEVKCKTFASP